MKKRIIIILSIIVALFLVGGIYIITTIESATSRLDRLITMHRVEILREHLLIGIHKVQSNLLLINTLFASDADTISSNINHVSKLSTTCLECHHKASEQKRLDQIIRDIQTIGTHIRQGLEAQMPDESLKIREMSYQQLVVLETQVEGIVHIASAKLERETNLAIEDIGRSKKILYALVGLTPLVAGALAFLFLRAMTEPIERLLEATRKLKSGHLDYHIEVMNNEFGEVATSFNQMSDALKKQMLQIKESETRYRMLFESAGDAIFILEAQGEARGRIVDANQAAAQMHGYTREEMSRLHIEDLDVPQDAALVNDRIQRMLNGEWIKAEVGHRRKDGSVFPVEISAGLMDLEGHRYILAFDRDVTERKEMEDMLRKSEQEWADTFDTITDMITLHDMDYNIVKSNKAAQQLLGLPREEGVGTKCYQYYHGKQTLPEDCPTCATVKTGRAASFDLFEPHLGKLLEIRSIPRFGADGQMIGVIHVARDISERKRMEESLQRAEQMKLVGEWATALAHEIKNPLAGIKVSVEVLSEELATDEDRNVAQKAVQEIKRIEQLIKSLLNFAKPPEPQLSRTDVNELVDKTTDFALKHPSQVADQNVTIEVAKALEPNMPQIVVDPMQLQQILLNLLLNSIEAMPDGGRLTVATQYDQKARTVAVEIADTGAGIAADDFEKIFQPFFTTKKKGSGLGLAITKRLVEQNEGRISVASEMGRGATFTIVFPVRNEVGG